VQRQPFGHCGELIAAAQASRTEVVFEEAPYSRHKTRAPGEKDTVHVARGNATARQ